MNGAIATLLFLGNVSFLLTSPGVRGASASNAPPTRRRGLPRLGWK
jgi:hypothetical protein